MSYQHMIDPSMPLSARAVALGAADLNPYLAMVTPELPLTGAFDRDRAIAMQEGAEEVEEDLDDDEDDDEDEDEDDDLGDDDDDLLGEDDDLGEDDLGEDDLGEDDEEEEFGILGIKGPKATRRLIAAMPTFSDEKLWRIVKQAGRKKEVKRAAMQELRRRGKASPGASAVARRGGTSAAAPAAYITTGPAVKPGAYVKPAPVPGAPGVVAQPAYTPVSQAARDRRGRMMERTERVAPGVRTGPKGGTYVRTDRGEWTRVGPKGGVREIDFTPRTGGVVGPRGGTWERTSPGHITGPRGGEYDRLAPGVRTGPQGGTYVRTAPGDWTRVGPQGGTQQFGAEVTNVGTALMAFPFQSAVVLTGAAVLGAFAAPFVRDLFSGFRR